MNIVYISDQYWPSISGVPVSIDAFKRELIKMGHTVFLLVPDYPNAIELDRKLNVENVFRFKSHKIFFNDENRLVYKSEKKRIFKVLNRIKPDIIHVHTEFIMGKIATLYAQKFRVPLVMTAHTNWEELINYYIYFIPSRIARIYCRARMRRTYNKADTVIVPTSLMEVLLNLYFVSTPIRVIPTGIDKAEFEVSDSIDEITLPLYKIYPQLRNHKILFFAGRIGKEKNITFLIDVLKKLLVDDSNIIFIITGDGPAREDIKKYALDNGVIEHILFTGFIERLKLKSFYSLANVFVFASKVESQGMVVLESMACGTPVVAIGKMGTREVMGGDSGGFMVDDELDTFVEGVKVLLNDALLYKIKAEEARQHSSKWTMQVQAIKMLKLYRALIKKYSEPYFITKVPKGDKYFAKFYKRFFSSTG